MDNLPVLRIPSPEPVEEVGEIEPENDTFFVEPTPEPTPEPNIVVEVTKKPKKPLSDKQRAHLAKAREKAQEKARAKREVRQAAEAKVIAEIIKATPTPKPPPPPHQMTEEFKTRMKIPTEEEVIEAKRLKEEAEFFQFASKMKKYNAFQSYLKKEEEAKEIARRPPTPVPTPTIKPISPVHKKPTSPVHNVNNLIKPIPVNPYDHLFQWE